MYFFCLCIDVSSVSLAKLQEIQWNTPILKCWDTRKSHVNQACQIWSALKKSNDFDKYVTLLLNFILQMYQQIPKYLVTSLLTNPKWDNSQLDSDILSLLHATDYGNILIESSKSDDETQSDDESSESDDESSQPDNESSKSDSDNQVQGVDDDDKKAYDELQKSISNQILVRLRAKLGDKVMLFRLLFDIKLCHEKELNVIEEHVNELIPNESRLVIPITLPVDIWQHICLFCTSQSAMCMSCVSSFFLNFIYSAAYARKHLGLRTLLLNDKCASKFIYHKSNTYLYKGMQDLIVKISGSMVRKTQLPYFTAINLKRYQTNGNFNLVVIPPGLEKVIVDFEDETWNKNHWILDHVWETFIQVSSRRHLKLFMLCNDDCFQFHHVPIAKVIVWFKSQIFGSLMKHIMFHDKIEDLLLIDTQIDHDYMLLHHRPQLQIRPRTFKNFYYLSKYSYVDWNTIVNTLTVFNFWQSFCPKCVIRCSVDAAEHPRFRSLLTLITKKTDLPMEIVIVIDCQSDSYSDYAEQHIYDRQFIDVIITDWLNKNYAKLTSNQSIKALKLGINVQANYVKGKGRKYAGFMFDVKEMLTLEQLNDNLLNIKKTIDHDSTRDTSGETMIIQEWAKILEQIYAKTQ